MSGTSDRDMSKAMFINLVMMLTSSAMQQLGKLMSPATDRVEVDLEGAQASIDILDMLRAKTTGNLDKDEQRMLDDALASLQMNFVETANARSKAPAPPEPAPAPASPGKEESAPVSGIEPGTGAEPKYHKSYGG